MVKIQLKEKLNGNQGFVITSGMIILIIAVTTFGFSITGRIEARVEEVAEHCVTEQLKDIQISLNQIQSQNESQQIDIEWMKKILDEIKKEIQNN